MNCVRRTDMIPAALSSPRAMAGAVNRRVTEYVLDVKGSRLMSYRPVQERRI